VEDGSSTSRGTTPPYRHIADVLRGEITDGTLAVGDRLPAYVDLEQRFGVARATIQRALAELRKDGFIDNQRGRAAEVLPWRDRFRGGGREDGASPGPSFSTLPLHLARAFEEPEVSIDVYCLTMETLHSALATPLQRIMEGELRPQTVSIRVLIPQQDAHLAIPRLVAERPGDDRPLDRVRQRILSQAGDLRDLLADVNMVRSEVRVSLEFRTVPITPMYKIYIFNHRSTLFGFYPVVKRKVSFATGGDLEEIYDLLGVSAQMFPFSANPDDSDEPGSLFVSEATTWFDSLWTQIAKPLDILP
jgi:hypothetical protein